MLIDIKRIIGAPVMSLQTGQPIARLTSAIVNPYNLKVVAFYVDGPLVDISPAVVFTEDIREFSDLGAIVDSSDNIMSPDGMVRLNEVISYDFHLEGITVIDNHKQKLGKVESYIVDPTTFDIMQLHVRPRLSQTFSLASLTVARQQIVSIDNKKIIVKAPDIRVRSKSGFADEAKLLNPEFDNPFRKRRTATESNIKQLPS